MAVRVGHVSLLLLGLIFLANKHPALAGADLFEKKLELGVDEQKIPRQDAIHVETDAAKNFLEGKENEHSALQKRGLTMSGGGRITGVNALSSIFPGTITMTGGHIDIQSGRTGESEGLVIKGYTRGKPAMMKSEQLFVDGKLVCTNVHDTQEEVTYQKSSDGSLWYTNIKVGEPMLPTEIEEFKKEWARYAEERAKKDAEREARLKREEGEREERIKRQQEELNARLKRQELERETRMKRQQDEQNTRMKRQEAEREMQLKQQQNELNRQLKRAQTQRETQWKRQQDELNARSKREEAEREARRKQEEEERDAGLKKQEKDFSESETGDSEDDDDFGSGNVISGNWIGTTGSYMFNGNQLTLSDFNGITITMSSPSKTQAIDIRGTRVTVNKKVVCRNSRELLAEPTYQKSKDGAMWYTNLKVGEPMTDEETEQFKAAIEKRRLEKEAEKKRKEEERERRRKEKEEERQRREEERERRRKEKEEERQRRQEERERQRKEREEERERKRKEKEERANFRRGRKSSRFQENDSWW